MHDYVLVYGNPLTTVKCVLGDDAALGSGRVGKFVTSFKP